MAGPVGSLVAGAAGAGARALPQVLRTAGNRITSWFGANNISASQQQAIATRLGLKNFSTSGVRKMVKENKFATAMVLYELYGAGDAMLQELADADEDVRMLVERFGFVPDEPEATNSVVQINDFREEFELISSAVAFFGSMDRYLKVKQAMTLSPATDKLYLQFRSMARDIR